MDVSFKGYSPTQYLLPVNNLGDINMSENNIYKEHYELQVAHNATMVSIQNIYNALFPLVSPEGVQLSLQEVIDLTVQKLQRFEGETSPTPEQVVDEVAQVAGTTEEASRDEKASRKK